MIKCKDIGETGKNLGNLKGFGKENEPFLSQFHLWGEAPTTISDDVSSFPFSRKK